MTDLLAALTAQNTRTIHLLLNGEDVTLVPAGTPGALPFTLRRVPAREIRSNLLYAALGRDGYVAYAQWFQAQAGRDLSAAQASAAKPGDAPPFDDSPPDDADWRAHTVALEDATDRALLDAGLILDAPLTLDDVWPVLGPYRGVLVRELVMWGREAPESRDSPGGNSVPP